MNKTAQITSLNATGKKGRLSAFWKELKKNKWLFLLNAPAMIYVLINNYMPMLGIVLAFKNYSYSKGIFGSDWVGFKNFEYLFQSGDVYRITVNTIFYNVAFIITNILFQVAVAILLSEIRGKKFKKVSQTLLLMPYFVTWVVVGAVVYNIFNTKYGVLNTLITSMGGEKVAFMNKPELWPFILVIFNVWKGLGYGSVVYLAAITGIDQEIYEAAQIDGANIWQRISHITLPSIKSTIMVLLLLDLSRVVHGNFQMFYNLTGNNPMVYNTTEIIDTYVYRSLITTNNYGMSSAAGLYQSVLGFILIIGFNWIMRKVEPDSALF